MLLLLAGIDVHAGLVESEREQVLQLGGWAGQSSEPLQPLLALLEGGELTPAQDAQLKAGRKTREKAEGLLPVTSDLPDDLAILAGNVQLEHVATFCTLDELQWDLWAETSQSISYSLLLRKASIAQRKTADGTWLHSKRK